MSAPPPYSAQDPAFNQGGHPPYPSQPPAGQPGYNQPPYPGAYPPSQPGYPPQSGYPPQTYPPQPGYGQPGYGQQPPNVVYVEKDKNRNKGYDDSDCFLMACCATLLCCLLWD